MTTEANTQWEDLLKELDSQQEVLNKALGSNEPEEPDKDEEQEKPENEEGGGEEDDEDAAIAALADGDADDDGKADNEDEDELFGKSIAVTTAEGERIEAFDGVALIKSLIDRQHEADGQVQVIARQTGALIKALSGAVAAKDAEIGKLREDVGLLKKAMVNLAGTGRGRKAMLTIHDRADAAPDGGAMEPKDVLAKANAAAEAGRITWREFAGVDTALRMKQKIDDSLLTRIAG